MIFFCIFLYTITGSSSYSSILISTSFLNKSITDGHFVMNPEALVRVVFIIQVVLWHAKNNGYTNILFLVGQRPWFNEIKKYANKYNINLISIPQIKKFYKKKNLYFFHLGRFNFPFLFYTINILKKIISFKNPFIKYNINNSKIYSQSLGHINFVNDGMNSDFFYLLNSNLKTNDIICENFDNDQLKLLKS